MKRITTFLALLMLVCIGAQAQLHVTKTGNDCLSASDLIAKVNAGGDVYVSLQQHQQTSSRYINSEGKLQTTFDPNGATTWKVEKSAATSNVAYVLKNVATGKYLSSLAESSNTAPGFSDDIASAIQLNPVQSGSGEQNVTESGYTIGHSIWYNIVGSNNRINTRDNNYIWQNGGQGIWTCIWTYEVTISSDYTSQVEAEIKPWVESAGKGLFTLDPEDDAVAQVIRLYQAGPADQKTWTKDEYDALKAALQKALGAEAYLLPETGYYHVRNKVHKTYIGYGTIQGKGNGLTLYDNTDDPSTTLLFTKIGANSYTIRTTAGNVGQAPTNATDQLYPVEGSGEKFQFVVIDAAQGLFTLTCGEFPNPKNASLTLGYLHGTNWGGVVSWTRDGDASHWTIEKASGPVVPPVVDPVNTELQLAINVLNNVPYALYPPTFDWDAPRAYKEYKNTYGRYQLASRLAVAILARLVDYATAEDDVKAKIAKDLADKYDIANFDAVLNDLLKSYARKVVETHGEAYALYEQGDENFSRMYDALAQAGVTDTEQYAAFLAAGSSSRKIRLDMWSGTTSTDPSISRYNNNVWNSTDGSLMATNSYNFIFGTNPNLNQRAYAGANNVFTFTALKGTIKSITLWSFYGNTKKFELEDGTIVEGDGTSTATSTTWNPGVTIPVNKESYVVKVVGDREYVDMTIEMEFDEDPYEVSGIERTLSDAYELLVKKLKDPKPFDATITSHIVNPNFANGTDGWNITEWGTDNGKPLTDSEGNTRPYYNYLNSWNKPNVIVDANQELTLPAGRYMLTVAGRGSSDHYREVSAASPEEFFQVYATNNQGVTRGQSIYPLEEEGENVGVFGNGWNDASVFFTMPSAGKAIVGVRAKTKAVRHWVSATRFRLTRVGDPTLFFDENQTYANKLEYDPIFEQLNQLAPVDIVLHKKMEPGKWYAMSLPANITKEQLAEKFGTGTRLAQLWGAEKTEAGAVAYFSSLPIATTNYFPTCPFLIQPEKVNANHMYVFHDVVGRHDYVASGVSSGEQGATSTEWGKGGTAKWGPGRGRDMRFVSNYTYDTAFDRGYNLEMSDTLKAFSAYLEAGDEEIVAVYVDGKEVILDQQLAQAARNGAALAKHYAGIPEAMINALKVTSTSNKIAALKAYRQATAEAAKAVAPSKEFWAVYAEAEELLASEHTELVSGADAAFKELLATHQASFNSLLLADKISELTEKLREEIEKFKTQIDQGLKELEAGMHLFYNIGSKKYLGGSNEWGTQASLTTHGELMGVTKLDDGKYTIETRFTNGNNFHGFAKDHRGIYFMDAAATGASLEIVCVKRGVYTISDAAGYLGYNGTNTVLGTGLTDANDANAQWIIVSEEELLKQMAEEASVKNPMDVTFLIQNPDFSRGHRDVAAWTFTCTDGRLNASNASAPADMGNYSAEANKASFDLSQELTVPNGVYVMEAQGAVTDNSGAYDGTDYPVFFANDATAPFLSMEEQHRGKSMLDLQKAFGEGKYFVEPMVVKVTDGQLTVGAKGTRTDLWATWDNFSLKFYGDVDINDVLELYGKTTGNEPTGIKTVDNGPLAADGWYSIDGRKLNGKPTKKGVYVVNGKKVIVK